MAYRRPGVTVTQEFQGLVPALAAFALPSVVVGPAYQLVDNDNLGVYGAVETLFPYASILGGAIADLAVADPLELFPITKKPIVATLKNAKVEVLAHQATGSVAGDVFSDVTSSQFANVVAGDVINVVEELAVSIVAARTDGASSNTAGQLNRLSAGAGNPLLFANVKVGDTVVVTAGTNTVTGTVTVTAKVGTALLLLSGAINDGVDVSTDVAYTITGNRGSINKGSYVVKSKFDDNTLVLQSPLADSPEAPLSYSIARKLGDVVLDRVSTISENGFVASVDGITLPAVLTNGSMPIVSGTLVVSYRALRVDLAANTAQFIDVGSLNSVFGVGQLLPTNPLGYGLSIMLQNTVTPVNGLGLDAGAVDNEVLSYTAATDVLKRGEMYAISLLTQSPVVHTLYKNHVEQLSAPGQKLERVVIINSKLPTTMILQEDSTTTTTVSGSRQIVGTQVDGSGVFATNPKKLTDGTAGQFANVQAGDSLVVVAGTGVTPGTYAVSSVTDDNNLITASAFLTSGSPTDIQYYIYRADGLSASGLRFYDRNAQFIVNGVSSGNYLNILSGTFKGRYKIATVVSDKEVTLSPAVLGVTTLVAGVEYQIDRDLQKVEQANAVKGYSEAFASRRVVHVWPDVLSAPIGQVTYDIPGYYATCAIAALSSGLPTQQGFTNLAISGFLGFKHSTRYFTEEELNTIAGGGTMVLAQDGESQPLYVRHQLTTDMSAIKFQEYSITKNVDYIAKFLRTGFRRFIGQYNIIDTTLDALKTSAGAFIKFLKDDTRVPRFGGVIRSGTLNTLSESTTQIDTLNIGFSFNIPVPLNNIDITIEV